MNTTRFKWGIFFTALYLIFIAVISKIVGLDFPKSLNELGDALAGIFAPIAFFWLILGYIQQGKQLEQNTKALEQQEQALQLQIDEMKEGVNQQRKLIDLQKLQINQLNNSVEPLFIFNNLEINCLGQGYEDDVIVGPDYALKFNLSNLGMEVRNLEIRNYKDKEVYSVIRLLNAEEIKVLIEMDSMDFKWDGNSLIGEFKILFSNYYGEMKYQNFRVEILYFNLDDYEIDQPSRVNISKLNSV